MNLSVINKYAGDIINQSIIMSEKREKREEQKSTDFYVHNSSDKERERERVNLTEANKRE